MTQVSVVQFLLWSALMHCIRFCRHSFGENGIWID
jgi:hypothetical protein